MPSCTAFWKVAADISSVEKKKKNNGSTWGRRADVQQQIHLLSPSDGNGSRAASTSAKLRRSLKLSDRSRNLWRNSFQDLHPESRSGLSQTSIVKHQDGRSFRLKESGSTRQIQNFCFTFWVIVSEQLDVELLGEGGQVRRHHAAGGQVDLVTAGLHLERDKRTSSAFGR